jgi:hypothetical protein
MSGSEGVRERSNDQKDHVRKRCRFIGQVYQEGGRSGSLLCQHSARGKEPTRGRDVRRRVVGLFEKAGFTEAGYTEPKQNPVFFKALLAIALSDDRRFDTSLRRNGAERGKPREVLAVD